jgi:hypothetical protein
MSGPQLRKTMQSTCELARLAWLVWLCVSQFSSSTRSVRSVALGTELRFMRRRACTGCADTSFSCAVCDEADHTRTRARGSYLKEPARADGVSAQVLGVHGIRAHDGHRGGVLLEELLKLRAGQVLVPVRLRAHTHTHAHTRLMISAG